MMTEEMLFQMFMQIDLIEHQLQDIKQQLKQNALSVDTSTNGK